MSRVIRMAIGCCVLATGFFALAADVGWLQTGVRAWYVGGVNTDQTLSEINYDFAARQAFAEDDGPLVFDASGYLENMAVKAPAMGIAVDSRTGSAGTMRIDGLAYYRSSMGGPVAPSGRPLVPNQCRITIPAGQNGRIAQDGFQFLLAGEAAFDYVSEFSDDLTHGLPLSTNRIADVRVPVTIQDHQAASLEKRFYRVRQLPALP